MHCHLVGAHVFSSNLTILNHFHGLIEYINKPITFDISDFKRRTSLEETLTPYGTLERKTDEVPGVFNGKCMEIVFIFAYLKAFSFFVSFIFFLSILFQRQNQKMRSSFENQKMNHII